ncbi:MAG: NAD(P)-binding domain-containing protein [Candidatus Marinimicrobia bacterium]|nr:NAD(P)-binding domain-containing protein [Candidatus Neomarinimicrobiota bacterium]
MKNFKNIAILGTGNIGMSIADGLLASNAMSAESITLTRRKIERLDKYKTMGIRTTTDNLAAVRTSQILIIAVEPGQIDALLAEISPELRQDYHTIISVVTGVSIDQIAAGAKKDVAIVRAMPNTAISLQESITCLASNTQHESALEVGVSIFNTVGKTVVIEENLMGAATALGACGIAFFLRAIRAASQGGIEIGFHSKNALLIAAQVAKGAAELILKMDNHPESEIDKVTTPRGVTIAGLNQMEHEGFSSAMIKGIVTSANKAQSVYKKN